MLAPIVLFVYNRPYHTLKTLKALGNNFLAKESTLYIFADGVKESATVLESESIAKVRKIIKETTCCGNVFIKERDNNIGLANSVILGVTEIINKYGKIIVLEDDIVCSPFFLEYMNFHLDKFVENEHVFGVSGFTYMDKKFSKNTYLLPILSSWGWATWQNRWNKFEIDANKLLPLINRNLFDFGGYPFFDMINDQIGKRINSWAICFYAKMFLENKYFIFPPVSLVKNIGFDNSGEHCGDVILFKNHTFPLNNFKYNPVLHQNKKIINKAAFEFSKILKAPKISFIKKIYIYLLNFLKGQVNKLKYTKVQKVKNGNYKKNLL